MTKEQIELAKRRAWVEEHFHYYGWTDEEVMAFPILPSSNFDEGFEAGIRLRRRSPGKRGIETERGALRGQQLLNAYREITEQTTNKPTSCHNCKPTAT